MCDNSQPLDYTKAAISMLGIPEQPDPRFTSAGATIYRPDPELGGYTSTVTKDPNDPGTAPEGYFSKYRFGADGQIEGSLDGKTFAPIDGLRVNQESILNAYKPSASQQQTNFTGGPLGNQQRLTEQLYNKQQDKFENAQNLFADGGTVKDFRVDKNGQLYARVNSGAGTPFQAGPFRIPAFGSNPERQQAYRNASAFEGYIPIEGFPLTEMEGNFGEGGRSAFFSPDGAIALNAGRKEEFPGLLSAYTRKKVQALKQADNVNLLTGTRGGG